MVASTGLKQHGVNLNKCSADQEHALGELFVGPSGAMYRYVKFVDAVTYVKGHVVGLASTSTYNVTNDRAGGSAIGATPVGVVFQDTVPTQNQYGWVQVTGIADVICTGAAVAAGDVLVIAASTDGAAEEADYTAVAHADFKTVGVALATIAAGDAGKVRLSGLI